MKFSTQHIQALREGLSELPLIDWHILYLRFWENYSIGEIAEALDMKWEEVNTTLDRLYVELKEFCLEHSSFRDSDTENSHHYEEVAV